LCGDEKQKELFGRTDLYCQCSVSVNPTGNTTALLTNNEFADSELFGFSLYPISTKHCLPLLLAVGIKLLHRYGCNGILDVLTHSPCQCCTKGVGNK